MPVSAFTRGRLRKRHESSSSSREKTKPPKRSRDRSRNVDTNSEINKRQPPSVDISTNCMDEKKEKPEYNGNLPPATYAEEQAEIRDRLCDIESKLNCLPETPGLPQIEIVAKQVEHQETTTKLNAVNSQRNDNAKQRDPIRKRKTISNSTTSSESLQNISKRRACSTAPRRKPTENLAIVDLPSILRRLRDDLVKQMQALQSQTLQKLTRKIDQLAEENKSIRSKIDCIATRLLAQP